MTTLAEVQSAADSLPPQQRAALLAHLYDTIDPADWLPPSDEVVAEAARRAEEVEAGKMAVEDWRTVRARVRQRVGLDAPG